MCKLDPQMADIVLSEKLKINGNLVESFAKVFVLEI